MSSSWPWPRVIAHRCGGALAPENTLAGLRIAAALGIRGVEFDVMLSADRVPVVIHDDDLDRCTDGRGAVRGQTCAELARRDAGVRHHPSFAGEPLPSLESLAGLCLDLGLAANIEIKCDEIDGDEMGRIVATAAARLWRDAPLAPLVSSFAQSALAASRRVAPFLPRGLLVERIPANWEILTRRLDCVSLHSDVRHWTVAQIREVRARGVWLAGYTENDPQRAAQWFAAGANALFTDRPDLLLPLVSGGCREAFGVSP